MPHEWSGMSRRKSRASWFRDTVALSSPNPPSVPGTCPTSQVTSADWSLWTCPKPAPTTSMHWRKGCGASSLARQLARPQGRGQTTIAAVCSGLGPPAGPSSRAQAVIAPVRQALAALRGGDPRLADPLQAAALLSKGFPCSLHQPRSL